MKAKAPKPGPFRDFLLTVLHYDPENGNLLWRIDWRDELSGKSRRCGNSAGKWRKERNSSYRRLVVELEGKEWSLARLVWLMQTGSWPREVIDHKDGDTSNNRWWNLRDVLRETNSRNRPGSAVRAKFLKQSEALLREADRV